MLVNRYLFLLMEQTESLREKIDDGYCWGQEINVRDFLARHKLKVVMGNFCSTEVMELKESESMPDLALAAQAQDITEEMHSALGTGSEELMDGVAPLTQSDSLATLTLHAEVDAGLNISGIAANEIDAEVPQSVEEAAVTIARVAVNLEEESGSLLSELDAGNVERS